MVRMFKAIDKRACFRDVTVSIHRFETIRSISKGALYRKVGFTSIIGNQHLATIEHMCFFAHQPEKKSFLWKIVTGDEKWIYNDNMVNKKQWFSPGKPPSMTPKPSINFKKECCVWWNCLL
jgi:hypothetical protein